MVRPTGFNLKHSLSKRERRAHIAQPIVTKFLMSKLFLMKFSPTKTQLAAAQQLFIAMAFRDTAQQAFEKMENEILQSGLYHYDDEYYSETWKKRWNGEFAPADKIIRHRRDINMMSGLMIYKEPGYEKTDSFKFYTELAKKATEAGFIYAENAFCIADNEVIGYQNELIKATHDIHKIELKNIIHSEDRKKLIDLLLNLFASFVKNESFEEMQRHFYNERMTEKVKLKNETYTDSEESFKRFQGLKQFFPLEEFLTKILERPDEKELFEGVEGICVYTEFAYLFQIKPGETWQYENFKSTSCRYVFINASDEIFESDNLEAVEHEVFKVFLKDYLK